MAEQSMTGSVQAMTARTLSFQRDGEQAARALREHRAATRDERQREKALVGWRSPVTRPRAV